MARHTDMAALGRRDAGPFVSHRGRPKQRQGLRGSPNQPLVATAYLSPALMRERKVDWGVQGRRGSPASERRRFSASGGPCRQWPRLGSLLAQRHRATQETKLWTFFFKRSTKVGEHTD